jgi:hypothetical protein
MHYRPRPSNVALFAGRRSRSPRSSAGLPWAIAVAAARSVPAAGRPSPPLWHALGNEDIVSG